jgi:hypothetical protein
MKQNPRTLGLAGLLLRVITVTCLVRTGNGICMPVTLEDEYSSASDVVLIRATGRTLPTECGTDVAEVSDADFVGKIYKENVPSFLVVDVFKGGLNRGDEIPILSYSDELIVSALELVPEVDYLIFLYGYSETCFGTTEHNQGPIVTDFPGSGMYWTIDCLSWRPWSGVPDSSKEFLENSSGKLPICHGMARWLQICKWPIRLN